jgi:hypothetical protein
MQAAQTFGDLLARRREWTFGFCGDPLKRRAHQAAISDPRLFAMA